jgi:hypothetical protein
MRGRGGAARIGNRRNSCDTCNNFAQNVMRLTRKRLADAHQNEYARLRLEVEVNLYPQVIETFNRKHPGWS